MKNLNQDDAKRICDKVLALTSADQCEVNLTGSRNGNIRYARNAVSTAGLIENTELAIAVAFGKKRLSPDEMVKDIKKGIYIVGDGSFSIDQQRYNFQFGGQLFYEIKDGKIGEMLEDVAYQANTQEFWNACSAICDERDWRMGGSFFDGKGQPSQSSIVSHGAPTTRFNGINVINTARKIG